MPNDNTSLEDLFASAGDNFDFNDGTLADLANMPLTGVEEVRMFQLPAGKYLLRQKDAKLEHATRTDNATQEVRNGLNLTIFYEILWVFAAFEDDRTPIEDTSKLLEKVHNMSFSTFAATKAKNAKEAYFDMMGKVKAHMVDRESWIDDESTNAMLLRTNDEIIYAECVRTDNRDKTGKYSNLRKIRKATEDEIQEMMAAFQAA